jgi:hypothetical protein
MAIETHNGLDVLAPLIGEWQVTSSLGETDGGAVTTTFEWELDGTAIVQRSRVPHSEIPDALAIITPGKSQGEFTQHYFDARGVVRLYAMTFDSGRWTLLREKQDFSPLQFAQRFVGEVDGEAGVIEGRWEMREPGDSDWQEDFRLTYRRT